MAFKLPYLLKNRNSNYYLRFLLPFNNTISKRHRLEIRFSLKTKELNEALSVYYVVVPHLKSRIKEFCSMDREQAHSTAEMAFLKSDLKKIVDERLDKFCDAAFEFGDHWKTRLAKRSLNQSILDSITAPLTEMMLESHSNASNARNQTLTSDKLKEDNIRLEDKNEKLIDFCKKLLSTKNLTTTSTIATSENKPLHELLKIYLNERKSRFASRTFTQVVSNLERFIEIVGIEQLSNDVGNNELDRYSNVIKTIAPNIAKSKTHVKPTGSAELVDFWVNAAKRNTGRTLATNGVETHFSCVRPFLKWCYQRNNISFNYEEYPSLKVPNKEDSDVLEKVPFSKEQLEKIFDSYLYGDKLRSREQPRYYHFWLPFIAHTTGARISEIVGLEKVDIRLQDGIWVLDLNETWRDPIRKKSNLSKRKKNESSVRLVPVPQVLIQAGFINYIERLKANDMIFPDLSIANEKALGDYASKWFNERFTKYIGLEKRTSDGKQGVSFHSFRHNFTTNLDKTTINGNTLNDSERHYLTGHAQEGQRNQTYNHGGVDLSRLKTFMDAMDHQVCLDNLNFERFKKRKRVAKS
ncbi:site-specific integrase [Aliiglaciecola sp. NS0011-25]|uniref:site-specific integrase n=1 Tax=Aliiglaciecola sp. NS0011-25 TaxID=3127654 RepID=UPI003107C621